jgi:hypothetical protein
MYVATVLMCIVLVAHAIRAHTRTSVITYGLLALIFANAVRELWRMWAGSAREWRPSS